METTHWLEIKPESCKPVNIYLNMRDVLRQNGSCETTMSCRKPGKNVARARVATSQWRRFGSALKSGHVWWEPVKWVESMGTSTCQAGSTVPARDVGLSACGCLKAYKRFSWWKYHLHSVFTSHFTTHCQCQGQRGWYCKQRCETPARCLIDS